MREKESRAAKALQRDSFLFVGPYAKSTVQTKPA